MSRPPHAREKVLDAFEAILIDDGERSATLDATAKAARVSKGGLLYHFASRDDLISGLIERLETLADADRDRMRTAPDGPVSYYVRTSVVEDAALARALVAASRVAQGGSTAASDALHRVRDAWAELLRPHVRDDTALDLVMLVGDGLYYNHTLGFAGAAAPESSGPMPTGEQLRKLIELTVRATS